MDEQFPILLAEDRADDVVLIRKAFASAFIPNPLYVVKDAEKVSPITPDNVGTQTGKYLRDQARNSNEPAAQHEQ